MSKIMTSNNGTDFVRTPDERFMSLPEFNYEPNYVEVDGLRMAYVDAGSDAGTPL